jgi:hypothetical protein
MVDADASFITSPNPTTNLGGNDTGTGGDIKLYPACLKG